MKKLMLFGRVCIYDGITFFIKDQHCIDHILSNEKKYNLQFSYLKYGDSLVSRFVGKYKNMSISSIRGGIRIGGSLHKWKNGNHNYDTFYWNEFLIVYQEIVDEFKFDPSQARILSLEGGLNNVLPEH